MLERDSSEGGGMQGLGAVQQMLSTMAGDAGEVDAAGALATEAEFEVSLSDLFEVVESRSFVVHMMARHAGCSNNISRN